MEEPGLISVRTEVVLDVLVGSIAQAVAARMPEPLPPPVEAALPAGPAGRVARAGWHARREEEARFERAREKDVLLEAMLGGIAACSALAAREPLERPQPEDRRAITWRVPGPGGHVRHYLAERAIGELPVSERAPALKRDWVFGFLLACAPPEAVR